MSESHSSNQCTHLNAAGRRCRMTVAPTHDTLCAHHLQQHLASEPDPEAVAAELLDGTGNLNTADRVNVLLANTVRQLARQRLDRQDALAIGYLAQLLLNTVPGVQKEYQAIRATQAKQALRNSGSKASAFSICRGVPSESKDHRAPGTDRIEPASACAPTAAPVLVESSDPSPHPATPPATAPATDSPHLLSAASCESPRGTEHEPTTLPLP